MDGECANPLWLEWMKVWYEDARTKNMKSATALKKACDSLKSCPLPMMHPSEAQALNGFGLKTCERLEKRLREHCEENGLPMPKRKSRKRMSASIEGSSLDMTPAKKPRKTTKSYVPQLRSGPYAILLALASISEMEMVSKQQLIEMAQQHCDASFVAPKDATSYHTAWSSMKTLLNKDLVKETRGPQKRYELTDEGWEVAEKIKKAGKAEEGSGVDNAHGSEETRLEKADNKTTTVGQKDKGRSNKKQRRKENTSSFSVPHVTIDIDDTDSSMSKGTTRHRPPLVDRTDLNTSLSSVRAAQRLGGLMNEKYATMALAKTSKSTQGSSTTVQASSGQDHTNTRLERNAYLAARIQPDEQDQKTTSDDVNFFELLSSSPPVAAPLIKSRNQVTLSNTGEPSAKAISAPLSRPELPQSHPLPTTYTPPAFQPIILSPSTFTLELILDNREIRSREDRTYIETELLQKHSIRPLIRSLPLGDFFWVAKLKDPTLLARQYGEEAGDLIALDYIVERKRLDDLIASIKDGRFREQKFRLHRSGVSNVVYLVEEIGLSQDTKTKYWAAMQTAVASTQVVDGFTVKRTKGLDESIRYLARMTRLMKSIYESKPLHLIPSRILSSTTYIPLLKHLRAAAAMRPTTTITTITTPHHHHHHHYNITYVSFASLASKTENRTLRDVFLRMLMTTKSLTADKALAIQRVWPTPRALVDAFAACCAGGGGGCGGGGHEERERMVERGVVDNGGGKVGRGLSRVVAEVWGGGE